MTRTISILSLLVTMLKADKAEDGLDNMWVGLVVSSGVFSKGVCSRLVTVGFSRLLATSSCHLSGSPTQQLLR